ncbi:MAG: GNAT family N-acetyltransferase [Alphaproteobacteria bacterium]|nr:GNAT family N-acetyltransferase [Alphaproteobacteria bacterium]
MKSQEFKTIQTKRLDLKPLVATFDFANYLFGVISKNIEFFKYMPWADIKNAEQEFDFLRSAEKGWKKQTKATYGLYLRDNGDFVGVCSFFDIDWDDEVGEIGYWLDPKYAKQGYMSEAANAVANEFFNTGFQRIVIKANPENIASCKTAEKCGFEREGLMRNCCFNLGLNKREDLVLYAKVK